jgi:hypothetical protein
VRPEAQFCALNWKKVWFAAHVTVLVPVGVAVTGVVEATAVYQKVGPCEYAVMQYAASCARATWPCEAAMDCGAMLVENALAAGHAVPSMVVRCATRTLVVAGQEVGLVNVAVTGPLPVSTTLPPVVGWLTISWTWRS